LLGRKLWPTITGKRLIRPLSGSDGPGGGQLFLGLLIMFARTEMLIPRLPQKYHKYHMTNGTYHIDILHFYTEAYALFVQEEAFVELGFDGLTELLKEYHLPSIARLWQTVTQATNYRHGQKEQGVFTFRKKEYQVIKQDIENLCGATLFLATINGELDTCYFDPECRYKFDDSYGIWNIAAD
jgi:hypothetical protein